MKHYWEPKKHMQLLRKLPEDLECRVQGCTLLFAKGFLCLRQFQQVIPGNVDIAKSLPPIHVRGGHLRDIRRADPGYSPATTASTFDAPNQNML